MQALTLADALDGLADGMNFADARHLAKAEGCIAFLTCDLKFAKTAKRRSSVPVMVPCP